MNQMKSFAVVLSAVALAFLSASPAKAAYTFQLYYQAQVSNLTATGSGTLNLTGLTPLSPFTSPTTAGVVPSLGVTVVGQLHSTSLIFYGYTGPSMTGSGGVTVASTGSGPQVGIQGSIDGFAKPVLTVPVGYVSGTPLFSTSEFHNTTLAALGLTPGNYTYSWGTGANADSLSVVVTTPEPSSVLMLLSALAGLVGLWQFRRLV